MYYIIIYVFVYHNCVCYFLLIKLFLTLEWESGVTYESLAVHIPEVPLVRGRIAYCILQSQLFNIKQSHHV